MDWFKAIWDAAVKLALKPLERLAGTIIDGITDTLKSVGSFVRDISSKLKNEEIKGLKSVYNTSSKILTFLAGSFTLAGMCFYFPAFMEVAAVIAFMYIAAWLSYTAFYLNKRSQEYSF